MRMLSLKSANKPGRAFVTQCSLSDHGYSEGLWNGVRGTGTGQTRVADGWKFWVFLALGLRSAANVSFRASSCALIWLRDINQIKARLWCHRLEGAHSWASHVRHFWAISSNRGGGGGGGGGGSLHLLANFNDSGDFVFSSKCHCHVLYPV